MASGVQGIEVSGGSGNDSITGSADDDILKGLDGDDETTQKFSMKKLSIKDGESEVPEVKSTTTMRTGTPMFRKAEEDRAKKVKEKRDANIDEYL